MSTRQRAERFSQYVGLELKGAIVSRGFTAKQVAEITDRSPAAFNRWLNGKAELPIVALSESCEVIGIEPSVIIENAYARMIMEFGELDGTRYEDEQVAGDVVEFPSRALPIGADGFPDYSNMSEEDAKHYGLAAKMEDEHIGFDETPNQP